MGWSLDLIEDKMKVIFEDVQFQVNRPDSIRHYVNVEYEGEINLVKKRKIVELFPDEVFVRFHPNSFGEKKTKGADPMENVKK